MNNNDIIIHKMNDILKLKKEVKSLKKTIILLNEELFYYRINNKNNKKKKKIDLQTSLFIDESDSENESSE